MNSLNYSFIFLLILIIGIFLFFKGLSVFSTSLSEIKNINYLKKLNNFNFFIIILIGFIFSSFIQSSSLCISIIIPFVAANIFTLPTCFYLIIGFNIGTVSSLWLNGLNLNYFSFICLFLCFIFFILYKIKQRKFLLTFSNLLFGLTIIIVSLSLLKSDFLIFKKTNIYNDLLKVITNNYFNPFIIGVILSATIQSGSVISTAFQNIYINTSIDLPYIILIILGSNLGSTITGILASLKYNDNSKIIAYFHVFLNLIGVLLILIFFHSFSNLLSYLTIMLNQNKGFELILCHLLFNIFSSIIVLPFINKLIYLFTLYK